VSLQTASNVSTVSKDACISVSGVSKTYRIFRREDQPSTAAEAMLKKVKESKRAKVVEHFDALHDVSFDVPWGEVVGIIGRNGAGKSTLLKIITRITAPTTGRIELGGRVGSLLEVGTGFHPELTGRENVYLNGTLLGMRRKDIKERFDAIVDFAGTEKFLDTQVKRYSTGMYIRLAFAVAASTFCPLLVLGIWWRRLTDVGALAGMLLGNAHVNIANFNLGRASRGADAICVVQLDERIPDAILSEIRKIPMVKQARALAF